MSFFGVRNRLIRQPGLVIAQMVSMNISLCQILSTGSLIEITSVQRIIAGRVDPVKEEALYEISFSW